jgi:hypothetical protein
VYVYVFCTLLYGGGFVALAASKRQESRVAFNFVVWGRQASPEVMNAAFADEVLNRLDALLAAPQPLNKDSEVYLAGKDVIKVVHSLASGAADAQFAFDRSTLVCTKPKQGCSAARMLPLSWQELANRVFRMCSTILTVCIVCALFVLASFFLVTVCISVE